MTRLLTLVLGGSLLLSLAGCDGARYMAYLLAPDNSTQTVEPEYDGLPTRSVAVVIFVDDSIEYYYPSIRYELSLAISEDLRKNVADVRLVDASRVVKYQDDQLDWNNRPLIEMGRVLGADYVLYVAVSEFSTREPGSVHLFRGRARAQASLYETAKPMDSCKVWQSGDFDTSYPDDSPVSMVEQDDREVRYMTEKQLADLIAKKFYKHTPAPVTEADQFSASQN